MTISPFQRLVSNTSDVFLGVGREQAAMNAANNTGNHPDLVDRFLRCPQWPSINKYDNDTTTQSFSPFGGDSNPDYIWDLPTSDGQTVAFAIASDQFTIPAGSTASFSVSLAAFADNAMEAKIELFERIGGSFVKAAPQPSGLGDLLLVSGDPNNPAIGLTINDPPFTFQDIQVYSTRFTAPSSKILKIVLSFEATNYLIQPQFASNPSSLNNPAGLQFVVDIYAENPAFLYVSNVDDNTVEIYDISNPATPAHITQFGAVDLTQPRGMAIIGTTLYVTNFNGASVEIYDITIPTAPVRITEINGGNLGGPNFLAITGTTLYVSSTADVVDIYDISNPTAPVHVTDFGAAGNSDMAITGTTLYLANFSGNTVAIYDITNPIAPVLVTQFNGLNLQQPTGLAITGTTLYVTNQSDVNVDIYDISSPTAPVRVTQFDANVSTPTDAVVIDTTLYLAGSNSNTVAIFDISNPTAPVFVKVFNGLNLDGPFGLAIFTLFD
ncbi:hypothetical protein L8956_26590 (plasmid) [Peribacillus frigoritolerans]|uniref:LVIVD repeat-containing protein n=1 Tax=Peribacillus frigoritolerans TaxID=450367 RepID=UPI001EFE5432|nr:hypothetical protein [Peribacillus frigoritolerans]ULM99889.1 hypothetical protein L8956_26590 [Peribacillus frigoritolerans]